MRKVLFVLLFLFAYDANAQNAYYDSKYIIDWLGYENPDNNSERHAQKIVLGILDQYFAKTVSSDTNRNPIVDSIYTVMARRNSVYISIDNDTHKIFFVKSLAGSDDVDKVILKKITDTINRYEGWDAIIEKNKNAIGNLRKLIENLNKNQLVVTSNSNDLIITANPNIATNSIIIPYRTRAGEASSVDTFIGAYRTSLVTLKKLEANSLDSIELKKLQLNSLDSNAFRKLILDSLVQGLTTGIAWMNNRKNSYNLDVQTLFLQLGDDLQKKFIETAFLGKEGLTPADFKRPQLDIAEQQQQALIRIEAQQNQPTVQLSNFKMPSQSDMIDALAIYVAKRFKQEAVIFMVDKLKDNMIADTLFTILFPETQKLLFSQEAFTVPHFGAEWKYAISKDYALMLDHILESEYIGDTLKSESFDMMHDAWLLAKMVEKKYSYVEIIRNFAKSEIGTMRTKPLQTFTTLSHIINEEFFNSSTPRRLGVERSDTFKTYAASVTRDYWVTPANFEKEVGYEQFSLILAMLEKRYDISIKEQLGVDLSDPLSLQVVRLERIKKWMLHNLLILNQFQKNQSTLFNRINDDDKSLFNGVTYWSFMNDIVESFLNPDILIGLKQFDKSELKHVFKVNEIYASFQSKNYPAAITQVMGIMDNLCDSRIGYMLSKDIKVGFDSTYVFSEEKFDLWHLKKTKRLQNNLLKYSAVFNQETNTEDLRMLRANIVNEFDTLAKHLFSKGISYDTAVFRRIRNSLAKYDWQDEANYGLGQAVGVIDSLIQTEEYKHLKDSLKLFKAALYDRILVLPGIYRDRLLNYENCYCKHLGKAKKYVSFLTEVMSAGSNPQMLSKILETHAAPPASYKVKRYTRFTIDIGSHLGVFSGAEIFPERHFALSKGEFVYGLTVPVGFNFTWAPAMKRRSGIMKYPFVRKNIRVKEFRGVSHTVSLSVIDIAAPVAYRLANGSDGELPKEVKWSQLFSPGLHWRWGLRNSPVCVSLGMQYTPQLRTLNSGEQTSALRACVGILFDMPLLFIKK